MNNKVFFGLVILAAGVLVGWFVLKGSGKLSLGNTSPTVTPTPGGSQFAGGYTGPSITGEPGEKGGVAARTVVTYTDSGFAPSPTTVTAGTTVTFVNESSRSMWVASDVHPTHQLLPGFDQLKGVAKGGTYEYSFTKVGRWTYHNHLNPSDLGVVVASQE